jgi:hypothetical protein
MMNLKNSFVILILVSIIFTSCQEKKVNKDNYGTLVYELKMYERENSLSFLKVEGDYSENFWGDKIDIDAEIINDAKVASFKDVQLRVTYFSKTKSVITTKDYVVYEVFLPQKKTKIVMKIENFKEAETISLEVVGAKGN